MGQPSAHGHEEGCVVVAMRRFPPPQSGDGDRHVRYPVPNMLDFSARVAGCKVFIKIDLRKGYYQIPMHPADIRKTAICTPFELFEFRRMPFGLRNAGNTFQLMMDGMLTGFSFVFCYLDDIIITSRDEQEHLEYLRKVFSRLHEAGLVINASMRVC
jgi:hypothetical protein